jgi:hypothetical protein
MANKQETKAATAMAAAVKIIQDFKPCSQTVAGESQP